MKKQIDNQLSILTQEEKDTIIESFAERLQSIIDNDGAITIKVFCGSMEFEADPCLSFNAEGSEFVIELVNAEIRFLTFQYISGENLDGNNPILHFKDITVEFDILDDEEDC
jgi:hypothetical protein